MRVGLLLPSLFSVTSPFNGVRKLAFATAEALELQTPIVVERLGPWTHHPTDRLDLVHAFGGPNGYEDGPAASSAPWVLSPIHDSQKSARSYRLAVAMGSTLPRVTTIPAEKRRLYHQVARINVLSSDERNRISESCGVDPSFISVVNAAVSRPLVVTDADVADARSRLALPSGYALAICDYGSRRKNIVRLVEACLSANIPLVLAGYARESSDLQAIRRLAGKSRSVRLLGGLSGPDCAALMKDCSVYCQPSLEEGAGMAAMEAATYGARVLASPVGGAAEHLGPDATYSDPTSVEAIADGLTLSLDSQRPGIVGDWVMSNRMWENTIVQLLESYDIALTRR